MKNIHDYKMAIVCLMLLITAVILWVLVSVVKEVNALC